jgi:hypothetical protein
LRGVNDIDHLVDITSLHEQHFKAVDKKLDDVSNELQCYSQLTRSTLPK